MSYFLLLFVNVNHYIMPANETNPGEIRLTNVNPELKQKLKDIAKKDANMKLGPWLKDQLEKLAKRSIF